MIPQDRLFLCRMVGSRNRLECVLYPSARSADAGASLRLARLLQTERWSLTSPGDALTRERAWMRLLFGGLSHVRASVREREKGDGVVAAIAAGAVSQVGRPVAGHCGIRISRGRGAEVPETLGRGGHRVDQEAERLAGGAVQGGA